MDTPNQVIADRYSLYNADNVSVLAQLPDASIGLSVYSPPFAQPSGGALYHYSSSPRDFSNSRTLAEFFEHYEYLAREVHRLTMPGRMTCVHVMDVPSGNTGCDTLYDFQGDVIRLHERVGFRLAARTAIWKEPLTVRNRTLAKALAHKTIVDDSSRATNAGADYLLTFRKGGANPAPITHPTGFLRYAGEREIPRELLSFKGWTGDQKLNRYSHFIWRNYASAFWDDIRLDNVLPFRDAKDPDDERHVHPLQLDVIDRCLDLWSNPGDVVLDPFGGIGSTAYAAVKAGRRAVSIELKASYFKQAVRNLEALAKEASSAPAADRQLSLIGGATE